MRTAVLKVTGPRAQLRAVAAFLLSFVLGCSPSADQRVVYAPVLAACADGTRQRIAEIPERSDYSARLVEFDVELSSHPALVGFVELKSEPDDTARLAGLARGLVRDCDRHMSRAFRKDSSEDAIALFEFLTQISERRVVFNDGDRNGPVDPAQVYFVDSGEQVDVFFRVEYE